MDKDMMLIYHAVKEKLDTDYDNVFYQTMKEDQPNQVGIYLYESANDVEDMCGDEVYNCIKVQIQVNTEQSEEGICKAMNYLSKFVDRIENEDSNVEGIEFISAQHIGPRALVIGKNNYNILVCRSLIDLKYTFKTN